MRRRKSRPAEPLYSLPDVGTHYPVLAAAVCKTKGPVIEFGCGHYSTPMLHLMCAQGHRKLVSVESNASWLKQFEDLRTSWHQFHLVAPGNEWQLKLVEKTFWSVAFVDHAPGMRRREEIERLRWGAAHIVIHDTEDKMYDYEPVLRKFRFRTDWRRYRVWTSVVSMGTPFSLKGNAPSQA